MSHPVLLERPRVAQALVEIVVVSGLSPVESDPWQAWLEARFPQAAWVRPLDGDWPDLDRWSARIDEVLARGQADRQRLLLAHGFGALAVMRHAMHGALAPSSAILVTPAQPRRFGQDATSLGYPLPYPGTLVAPQGGAHGESPWLQDEDAQAWAQRWGCRLVDAGRGPVPHPFAVSGATPPWPEAEAVLASHMAPLLARARVAAQVALGFAA
jgi:predicted alpha/beta hydrolase family esterase